MLEPESDKVSKKSHRSSSPSSKSKRDKKSRAESPSSSRSRPPSTPGSTKSSKKKVKHEKLPARALALMSPTTNEYVTIDVLDIVNHKAKPARRNSTDSLASTHHGNSESSLADPSHPVWIDDREEVIVKKDVKEKRVLFMKDVHGRYVRVEDTGNDDKDTSNSILEETWKEKLGSFSRVSLNSF